VKRPKRVGVLSERERASLCEPGVISVETIERAVLLAAARRMKRLFGRDDEVVAADILRSWAREIPR